MATITINISDKVKTFLESEEIDVTQMAQNLLDNHVSNIVTDRYHTALTTEDKVDEIIIKKGVK